MRDEGSGVTTQQKEAVVALSRCRLYHRRERARVKAWLLMLECDPELEIEPYENVALMGYLHHYRRQHGRCTCGKCFAVTMERLSLPTQFSLFGTGGYDA